MTGAEKAARPHQREPESMPIKKIQTQLEAELKGLEYELRIELPKEISTAVAMGPGR